MARGAFESRHIWTHDEHHRHWGGAIGGHIAARLAAAGESVSVVARGDAFEGDPRARPYLKEGGEEIVARVEATDRIAEAGGPISSCSGSRRTSSPPIAADVASILSPRPWSLTTQNGIPWWYFFKHGGPTRAFGSRASIPAA